jgi:hypothetical protein
MSVGPGPHIENELQRGPQDFRPAPRDLGLFARIEGLAGEEDALLRIPARDRSPEQHARLRDIAHELDRTFDRLRERAERIGHHDAADRPA